MAVTLIIGLTPLLTGWAGGAKQGESETAAVATNPPPQVVLPPLAKAQWIWRTQTDEFCQVRRVFSLEEIPVAANILITADNGYELFVNGAFVGADVGADGSIWSSVERYDVTSRLARGRNVIGIRASDLGGIRGLVVAARIEVKGRPPLELVSDAQWKVALESEPVDYSHPEFVEKSDWTNATVLGPVGMTPWGTLAYDEAQAQARQTVYQKPVELTPPGADFRWPASLAFLGDDCSVYVPLRGDAWGVCFRVQDWSRAYTEFDLPCPSKIGRKLYTLKPGPGAKPHLLVDAGQGAIGSPSVSYDGQFIYVAMAFREEAFFHIYRISVPDGDMERLTDGPFHDIDPEELPDGRIVFSSTRIGSFEEYHNPPSRALFTMRADGSNIQPLTFTPIFDNEPKVMADGRIAFIRTDNFFDRAKVETQIHVIRPDGTGGLTAIGAQVGADYGVRLRAFGYGSPAPLPDGRLACISSRGNFICESGGSEASAHRLPDHLGDLAPLPDGRLLATVLRPGAARMKSNIIAVIDPADNQLVPIFDSAEGPVHSPVFVGTRPRPPVLIDQLDHQSMGRPGATGFLFCQNARFTRKNKADWAQIKAIRVLGALALTTRSSHSHIVHAGHQTVELGTVPLAPDGSFSIEVPADLPLALQAVDAEGRSELNEMSWIYVRPGERRSCVGCHQSPQTISSLDLRRSQALKTPPLKLLGQGQAHRFRGNNSGVTGMMDLQFERFRETASLNRFRSGVEPLTRREEIATLIAQLEGKGEGFESATAQRQQVRRSDETPLQRREALKISAAQRLGLFRDRTAAPALAARLRYSSRETRVAAALALAACGNRASVMPLLAALEDEDCVVAQAALTALENLLGTVVPVEAYADLSLRKTQVQAWRTEFVQRGWDTFEKALIAQLDQEGVNLRRTVVALGHIGGEPARSALRQFVTTEKDKNPYPPFVNDNRTDSFTFSAESPFNPRTLQEAVRALGYLQDTQAVSLLAGILAQHTEPQTGNLFLAEAAVEALSQIATPEAESVLIKTFKQLKEYWRYVGWYSDHPALYACHNSPLHARILEALSAIGSRRAGPIVPQLIGSVPTDPDRALFPESDDYETLLGRVIRQSGRADEVIETCLALLGDPQARATPELQQAISTTFPAWAGHPNPENRAAQVLSFVYDRRFEPRIRAAYERYRAKPEDAISRPLGNPTWIPQRHWVLFYLGRSLGNLQDPRSTETLLASLKAELNEARHGRPDPSEPNIHFLQLEYTPCWRATAAWALGRIGDRQASATLLNVVRDLNNATDVRHAAAVALGRLADPDHLEPLRNLAQDYPEYSIRRALLWSTAKTTGTAPDLLLD